MSTGRPSWAWCRMEKVWFSQHLFHFSAALTSSVPMFEGTSCQGNRVFLWMASGPPDACQTRTWKFDHPTSPHPTEGQLVQRALPGLKVASLDRTESFIKTIEIGVNVAWNVSHINVFIPAWMVPPVYHSLRLEEIKCRNPGRPWGSNPCAQPGLKMRQPPKLLQNQCMDYASSSKRTSCPLATIPNSKPHTGQLRRF